MRNKPLTDNNPYNDVIVHKATVVALSPDNTDAKVRVTDADECAACAAASLCGVNNGKKGTVINAAVGKGLNPKVGDIVEISGTEQLHRKAIRLATVYPTLAILAVMIGLYLITADQLVAALGGIATMIVFFVCLWLARKKLAREFLFVITEVKTSDSNK